MAYYLNKYSNDKNFRHFEVFLQNIFGYIKPNTKYGVGLLHVFLSVLSEPLSWILDCYPCNFI